MYRTKFIVLVVAALALAVTGCSLAVHGGGVVTLLDVELNDEDLLPGSATMAISFQCSDNKNAVSGSFAWNDLANNVQFTARLPWTLVSEATNGMYSTCEELAAYGESYNFHGAGAVGYITTQGQSTGAAQIAVGEPGTEADCGTLSPVVVQANLDTNTDYWAIGCLDRGKLNFR